MTEPMLFGYPISLLFLFFLIYALLGWAMETTYCSIGAKRFVPRGFLYGPFCPIYGVGVLMMVCWFQPLMDRPVLFYLTATVCMSAWEYFVGWFLETTTHIKYWDYSMYRFNIKGRICLWVCLMWGVLSFLILYLVHPTVSGLVLLIPTFVRQILALVLAVLLAADATATIRELALTSRSMAKLRQAGDGLRVQLALGKAELGDLLDAHYEELLNKAERYSRRFRAHYTTMSSRSWSETLDEVREAGNDLKARLRQARRERKAARRKH